MTLPQSGVVIHADNVYLSQSTPADLVSLDEHAEEVRNVLIADREIENWRRRLVEDLTNAEYFRDELRKVLSLADQEAAKYGDPDLVATVAMRLQCGELDREAVNRVIATVADYPPDWSAEDLARAVRSALHPLSSQGAVVTGTMPAVTPTSVQDTAEVAAQPRAGFTVAETAVTIENNVMETAARQPALTQLPSDHPDDLFRSAP
jgi:hypothetical protein